MSWHACWCSRRIGNLETYSLYHNNVVNHGRPNNGEPHIWDGYPQTMVIWLSFGDARMWFWWTTHRWPLGLRPENGMLVPVLSFGNVEYLTWTNGQDETFDDVDGWSPWIITMNHHHIMMLKFMIQTAHHLAILNGTGDQLIFSARSAAGTGTTIRSDRDRDGTAGYGRSQGNGNGWQLAAGSTTTVVPMISGD